MKRLNKPGGVYVVGDIHARPERMLSSLSYLNVRNADVILLGDIGIGFGGNVLNGCVTYLNRIAADRNNTFHLIRGNHDNPKCWSPYGIRTLYKECDAFRRGRRISLLPDLSVLLVGDKRVLVVGGAVSVDRCYGRRISFMGMEARTHRVEGDEWWPNETLPYKAIENLDLKVDAVLAHTGPVPPIMQGSDLLQRIHKVYDADLLKDIERERRAVDLVIERTGAKMWWNGHYHIGKGIVEETLGGVRFLPGASSGKEFMHKGCHVVNLGIDEVRKLELI